MKIFNTIKRTFIKPKTSMLNESEMIFKNVKSSTKKSETNTTEKDLNHIGVITKTLYFPIMKMEYPKNINSLKAKMKYEARLAKINLTAPETKEIINNLLDTLLIKIEENPIPEEDATYDFIGKTQQENRHSMPKYTNLPRIQNKSDFITALRIIRSNEKESDYAVLALSFLWNATRGLNWLYNRTLAHDIDDAYSNIKSIGKQDKISSFFEHRGSDGVPYQRLKLGTFGAAEINSNLNDRLSPIYLLKDYYEKDRNNKDYKPLVSKRKGYPYLAGTSGMCNMFYGIFDLIRITYPSTEGCKMADLMSSFVVGIGFHTFQECYDAFNFTHYYVEESQKNNFRKMENIHS